MASSLAATAQNATMYFRMQGLHASIHHLRETGVIGNFGYRQTFFLLTDGQCPPVDSSSTPRAESALGEFDDTGFVRNTEQSAADWTTLLHGKSPDLTITESVS